MCYRFQVAFEKMLFFPVKYFLHDSIFFCQCRIRYGPAIRVDAHGNAGMVDLIGGMIFYFFINIGLNITCGTNLEVNIFFFEKFD